MDRGQARHFATETTRIGSLRDRWSRLLSIVGLRHPRHRRADVIHRWRLGWSGACVLAATILITSAVLVQRGGTGGEVAVVAGGRQTTTSARATNSTPGSTPSSRTTSSSARPTTTTKSSAAPRPAEITLAFAGDLMPHGPLDAAAARFGKARGVAYDFSPMLAPLRPILTAVDLPICHFEVPVAPTRAQISSYPVFGAPAELVAGAREAGYKGCSTVSNHSLDKGLAGIRSTIATFTINGLGHAGIANSAEEARRPTMYDVKGVKVAHLAYAYGFNGFTPPPDAPWAVNTIDPGRIVADARAARAAGADLVVVSLHWGTEGVQALDALQRRVAPILADDPDIDLIIGHHAHLVQPIDLLNGKYVAYGLGNQLSNQTKDRQRDGLLVVVTVKLALNGRYHPTAMRGVPTWMDLTSWRVLPTALTLADPATPAALRAQLKASSQRTVAAATADGPVAGLTFDPLPR